MSRARLDLLAELDTVIAGLRANLDEALAVRAKLTAQIARTARAASLAELRPGAMVRVIAAGSRRSGTAGRVEEVWRECALPVLVIFADNKCLWFRADELTLVQSAPVTA